MYRKTRNIHYTDPGHFDQYYLNQVGSGMSFYQGSPGLQRGYGLGGLLGGLFRSAIPLLKKGAATVGKQALQTGMEIAEDVISGQNIKSATKRRVKQAGKQLGAKVKRRVQTGKGKRGRKPKPKTRGIKRKNQGQSVSLNGSKRGRRSYNDIFG